MIGSTQPSDTHSIEGFCFSFHDLFENRILLEREKKMLPILVFEFASRCILLHASLRSFESLSKWLQDDDEREFGEAAKQWITFWGVRRFFF